ncbi:MAG: encapsulin-associated ferritin-like protein [Halanaerobiales bacterium]
MAEFHEDNLSEEAKEYHRIIQSVIEELEAVNWYNQRADATNDPQVQSIVEHNRDEEIEHACMGLEWLRRNSPVWDEMLRTFLFTDADITHIEEDEEGEGAEESNGTSGSGSLGISSLKGGNN